MDKASSMCRFQYEKRDFSILRMSQDITGLRKRVFFFFFCVGWVECFGVGKENNRICCLLCIFEAWYIVMSLKLGIII